MKDIKFDLKVFGERNNVGRIWANSHINLAVQVDTDVWQFVCVGTRSNRDRNLPRLIPVIWIVDTKSPVNYPKIWLGQRDTWWSFWGFLPHTEVFEMCTLG